MTFELKHFLFYTIVSSVLAAHLALADSQTPESKSLDSAPNAPSTQNTQSPNTPPSTPNHSSLDSTDTPTTQHTLNEVSVIAKKNASLDSLSRNTYTLDKSQITDKGYTSATNIFSYMPFVGLNNTGLGSNIDLRAQGARANTSVQVLINGVYANMLDSSHGVTPLNTIAPNSIESIEILPGGGAVMYGNGTRGGVVSISTLKRYESPYFSLGLGYGNIIASTGHTINADVKVGTKLNKSTSTPIYLSLGAVYIHRGGPRVGDLTQGAQANAAIIVDFSDKGSLDFSLDYFGGVITSSPNNSFQITPNPSKADRAKAGFGRFYNTQHRLDANLGYVAYLSERQKLDVRTFFHLNRIDYVDSITTLKQYGFNGVSLSNVAANQNGSYFDDKKAGVLVKYDMHHTNGRFIAGLESIYNRGERVMNQHILWSGNAQMPQRPPNGSTTTITKYDHTMKIPFTGSKWSNALYVLEKYDFSKSFALTAGARYEYAYYDIDVAYDSKMNMEMSQNGGGEVEWAVTDAPKRIQHP